MSNLKKYLNVYDFRTTLPGSGKEVNYKGVSTNTIKKMLVYQNEDDPLKEEEILDHILEISVVDKDFKAENQILNDRYYLIVKIREATKGSMYTFQYKCPNCKSESVQNIDLNDLIKDNRKDKKSNNIIKISNEQLKVFLEHPLRSKQKQLYENIDKKLSNEEKYVEMGLYTILSYINKIETPEGEDSSSPIELKEFIAELPDFELEKFKDWINKNEVVFDTSVKIQCRFCQHTQEMKIPMSNFFS